MPKNWNFTNNPADSIPELEIMANGASSGDKIHLYNILTGAYGTPNISTVGELGETGEAEKIKITFSKGSGQFQPYELGQIELKPTWRMNDHYKDRTISNFTEYEISVWNGLVEGHNPAEFQWLFESIYAKDEDGNIAQYFNPIEIKTLYFELSQSDWDKIKHHNPTVTIRKYKRKRKAGFKDLTSAPIQEIPLTGLKTVIDFRVEDYFRIRRAKFYEPNSIKFRAKGGKDSNASRQASHIFEFRLKTGTGNTAVESNRPLRIKAVANNNGSDVVGRIGYSLIP